MNIIETEIEGVFIIEPRVFEDERGYFFESFNAKLWKEKTGVELEFVQDNESKSNKGVLRGLHFQAPPYAQAKLVRVVSGKVLDVAVDLRKGSKTYGQHVTAVLSAENKRQFFIPEGFAHGFLTLEDNTIFSYKCTGFYNHESEGGLMWNDPILNIDWKINNPILSEKDKDYKIFDTFVTPFTD